MTSFLLLPAAIWLLSLTATGYARAWKAAGLMNGLAIASAACIFFVADDLVIAEMEQPELAREVTVFLAVAVAAAGVVGTLMGFLLSAVKNIDLRSDRELEGSSE